MEFLKQILSEETYAKLQEELNAHNEKNPDATVKIGNLGSGDYVAKGKYESELKTSTEKLTAANALIDQLKKASKSDEALQQKVQTYEQTIQRLENELKETQIASAIKIGLLDESAKDVDYLTYKLRAKGEALELDESGRIKGWNDKIAALKVQCPDFFDSGKTGRFKDFDPIDSGKKETPGTGLTKDQLLKKGYKAIIEFKNENPEAYAEIMGG